MRGSSVGSTDKVLKFVPDVSQAPEPQWEMAIADPITHTDLSLIKRSCPGNSDADSAQRAHQADTWSAELACRISYDVVDSPRLIGGRHAPHSNRPLRADAGRLRQRARL